MRAGATSLPRVAIGRAQAKGAGGATQGRAGCREVPRRAARARAGGVGAWSCFRGKGWLGS